MIIDSTSPTSATGASVAERAETALLDLVADRAFSTIGLADLAERAAVGLADLRRLYDRPVDVLVGFTRRIDVAVLDGGDPETAAGGRRDRLFDVLMRRFDLLAPHRAGLRGLARSARRDPRLALRLTTLVVGSQVWMLEASGVATGGLVGAFRAPVLAAALARVIPVFLDEADPALPKTMKAVDETLDRLVRLDRRVTGLAGFCRRSAPPAGEGSEGNGGEREKTA
jgi:hypothetical protein